ncbi:hypothetical protein Q3G72_013960 [Acer saccharum]|nr:hypothetical protein Q3G72_013960 [Acer saccharum]
MTRFKEFILSDFSNKNKKLFLALVATLLLVLSAVISMVAGVHSRKNSDDKESSTASHVILKTSCDNTRYPDLCYSSIANAPGAMKKVTSQKDVIELSLNLTTTAVEHNFFKIEKLFMKTIDLTKKEKTASLA